MGSPSASRRSRLRLLLGSAWPPVVAMLLPAATMVGPRISPARMALRSFSASSPPRSRTVVNPASRVRSALRSVGLGFAQLGAQVVHLRAGFAAQVHVHVDQARQAVVAAQVHAGLVGRSLGARQQAGDAPVLDHQAEPFAPLAAAQVEHPSAVEGQRLGATGNYRKQQAEQAHGEGPEVESRFCASRELL
jgi:hypothetical protein